MGDDLVFGRQAERQRLEGGVERRVVGDGGQRVEVFGVDRRLRICGEAGEQRERVGAAGLPLVEGVAVVGEQEGALGGAVSRSRITGAEKPRSSEGTGRAVSSQEKDCRASSSSSTPSATSAPSGSSRP